MHTTTLPKWLIWDWLLAKIKMVTTWQVKDYVCLSCSWELLTDVDKKGTFFLAHWRVEIIPRFRILLFMHWSHGDCCSQPLCPPVQAITGKLQGESNGNCESMKYIGGVGTPLSWYRYTAVWQIFFFLVSLTLTWVSMLCCAHTPW